jgi:hypothetical protein
MTEKKLKFLEGRDFYFEKGKIIMTESYLAQRGECCSSGCRHCPFDPPHTKGNVKLKEKDVKDNNHKG